MSIDKILYYFEIYIFILGILLIAASFIEFIFPEFIYNLWNRLVKSKIFIIYGFFLILGGFPLTQFRSSISGIIMLIFGLVVVFTGPFIIIFPDRMREIFIKTVDEMQPFEKKRLLKADAITRFILGSFLILKFLYFGM